MINYRIIPLFPLCATVLLCCQFLCASSQAQQAKPKAAVFPLSGTASQDQRDKVAFSLRSKLDRDAHFDPIDGPTMADLTADKTITLSTKPEELITLSKDESPTLLLWGELNTSGTGFDLKIKTRDLRQKDQSPIETDKKIAQPTDLRFAIEQILQNINGIGEFNHPIQDAAKDDPQSQQLWNTNPNLVIDPKLQDPKSWLAILRSEKYFAPLSNHLPAQDKVVIYQSNNHNVLAMNLSKDVAESNGLACLSAPITIQPNTRYRLQFKYQSDNPTLHVFVKGYIRKKDISGQLADLQSYECQVPPTGSTKGQWKTITCDINPQNPANSPAFLKIDLYAYLSPGQVLFDDIQLKAVGKMTRHAQDDALKAPTTTP